MEDRKDRADLVKIIVVLCIFGACWISSE